MCSAWSICHIDSGFVGIDNARLVCIIAAYGEWDLPLPCIVAMNVDPKRGLAVGVQADSAARGGLTIDGPGKTASGLYPPKH